MLSPENNDAESREADDVDEIYIRHYEKRVVSCAMTLNAIVSLQVVVAKCLFLIQAKPSTGRWQDIGCFGARAKVRHKQEEEQIPVDKLFGV